MIDDVKRKTDEADDAEDGRKTLRTSATPAAMAKLKRFAAKRGMKEYYAAGKLIDWFAAQDDIFQRAVMGMMEGMEVDAADAYMRRLAAATQGDDDGTMPSPAAEPAEPEAAGSPPPPPPPSREGKAKTRR